MKRIGTRFFLALGLFMAAFSVLLLYRTWQATDRHVRDLTARQGELALEFDLAIREYVAQNVRPIVAERIPADEFIPEAMSTSFVARSVFEKVRRRFPDYIIKFSSDNPRNAANLAGPEELAVLERFRANPALERWAGQVEINGRPYLAHFSARRMKPSCLRCHGRPGDAPASMRRRYGETAGFHRAVGDVVALDTVAIPVDSVRSAMMRAVAGQVGLIAAGLVGLFAAVAVAFRLLVGRRLAAITGHFRAAAEAPESAPLEPVAVRGDDEIGILARSFNALVARLRVLHASLEQRVEGRTRQLQAEVAERRRAEQQLRAAKDAAEAASRAKSAFLANMSHEIRTPMNGVMGMIHLALETDLSAEQRDFLQTARTAATDLMRILNDILDFSKVEAGKLTLAPEPFALRAFLDRTVRTQAGPAGTKGLTLRNEVADDVPDGLVGDSGRLGQVLANLVGNAVKFTEAGEVAVSTTLAERRDSRVVLRFAVRDTGIGIPPEKQRVIFEAFEQADGSVTRRYGGTGLGLAISTQLVGLMGGQMGLDSRPAAGSTFWFTVPFALAGQCERAPEADAPESDTFEAAPLRILLAEDNDLNRKLVVRILEVRGHEVVAARDGAEALAALERERFDVVFMDVQMPGMDGLAATREARRRERQTGRHQWIVAMTAHAMEQDRQVCLEAGMDDYISKPIDIHELSRALRSVPPAGGPPAAEPPCWDRAAALERVEGDEELLVEIAGVFLVEMPGMLEAVEAAWRSRDAKLLGEAAHRLKGSVGNFAAGGAFEAALAVEMAGRSGEVDAAAEPLERLKAELDRLAPQLRRFVEEAGAAAGSAR